MRNRGWRAALVALLAVAAWAHGGEPTAEQRIDEVRALLDAGEQAKGVAAAKRVLSDLPNDEASFAVLRELIARKVPVPRVATSLDVLRAWTFDRVDGRKEPDLRLGLIDVIEARYPDSETVKEGGTLYSRTWCLEAAGRAAEAVECGERYLRKFRDESRADEVRFLTARAMLALAPPDVAGARRLLAPLVKDEKSKYHERAQQLLVAAATGGANVQITEGYPRAEGLGKVVLLTDLAAGDARSKALAPWVEARRAQVVRFDAYDLEKSADALRAIGPEFVAVATAPTTVDINFHLSMIELCRSLDADPMPDFHFGYLCARDEADLRAFTARILAKEAARGRDARSIGELRAAEQVKGADFILHFGHGVPWAAVGGLTGAEVARLELPQSPVVFSGACFHGVLSKSWHASQLQTSFQQPEEIAPERLVSLGWVHAGATGLLAGMEGDRGEMALAEWDYFRATAASLGETVGLEYRLAFLSLDESYGRFPRYRPGVRKGMSFFDVMLRGTVSRMLLSDPSYRPLTEPLDPPALRATCALDGTTCTAEVEVLRPTQGLLTHCLPAKGDRFDHRVYARVELPPEVRGRLGTPEVRAEARGAAIELARTAVRHEMWGGRRFVNVLAQSQDARLAAPGARVTFVFPTGK